MTQRFWTDTLWTAAALATAAGCATQSGAPRPDDVFVPEPPGEWTAEISQTAARADWIGQFSSQPLADLIEEALEANNDLGAAAARVEASRESARAAFGRSLPSIDAGVSAGASRSVFRALGEPIRNDEAAYSWSADASWEADLWGRVAASVAAPRADLVAVEADFAAARLSIAANTAIAWLTLSNAIAQRDLSEDERTTLQRSLTLTERRFSSGLSSALDVRLARSAEATARATIASSEQAVAEAARALEVLLGRYPAAAVDAPSALPALPTIQAGGEPADLLARRPDIAASEARLIAAGFRADAARAALRPALRLTASTGANDELISSLVDPDQLTGSIFAGLTAPIFNGGALKADARAAEASAREFAANYAQTILTAWREVEDARTADVSLALQETALAEALSEAEAAEALAERQYQQGLISIFNLIDSQSRRISAERQIVSTRASRAINRVQYHLALGGDDAPLEAATIAQTALAPPEESLAP